jgi:DNA-binding NarL/FixJ family response regulator
MTVVVICDAPSTYRPNLAQRVAAVPHVESVVVVDDVAALEDELSQRDADIVLIASQFGRDTTAPAIRHIHQQMPGLHMMLLTMGTDPDDIVAGLGAGAVGYLARDAALAEVAAALALLPLRDQLGRSASHLTSPTQDQAHDELTERELQVLQGMSRGRSNSEIGVDLFLSEDTIKTHARRLFRKMQVSDRAHAVAEGFRRGLLG